MWSRLAALAIAALAAAGASAQEREWRFETDENEAYLIFGVSGSDDIGLSFWCKTGSGVVYLYLPRLGEDILLGKSVVLDVKLGGQHYAYRADTSPLDGTSLVDAEAEIRADDRLFPALLSQDRFTIATVGEEFNYPLDGADVAQLLGRCRSQPR